MNARSQASLALALGSFAALASQSLSYALVYPAAARGSKVPVVLALVFGAVTAALAVVLGWRALARSRLPSERFLSLLAVALSGFFLLLVVVGFGIPELVLSPKD